MVGGKMKFQYNNGQVVDYNQSDAEKLEKMGKGIILEKVEIKRETKKPWEKRSAN